MRRFHTFKIILFFSVLVLLTGCAVNKEINETTENTPEKNIRFANAANYYALAEAAVLQKEYLTAVGLFKRADEEDPDNIYVKEKLIELLSFLALYDAKFNSEVISIGKEFYKRKLYSSEILLFLAEAYRTEENYIEADKFYKLTLKDNPKAGYFISYYIFQKNFYPPADEKLLYKAVEMPEISREYMLTAAEFLSEVDVEKSTEIAEAAYIKYKDEYSLKMLLTVYEKSKNFVAIKQLLQRRIDESEILSNPLKTYLIRNYFFSAEYEKILANTEMCFSVNNNDILRYLFFAAIETQNYEVAISAGKAIEILGDLPEELVSPFNAYFGDAYYSAGLDDKAVKYFAMSTTYDVILELLRKYAGERDRMDKLAHNISELLEDDPGNLIQGFSSYLQKDAKNAEQMLTKVSLDFLKVHNLVREVAITHLDNSGNIELATQLLEEVEDKSVSADQTIALFFYNSGEDKIAYKYFMNELEENPKPDLGIFVITSVIAERIDTSEQTLKILEKGLNLYPKSPDILNAYGYFVANNNIKEKYEEAEKHLSVALEQEPQNLMIKDSMAWLYFKIGRYEDALSAMEITSDTFVENSEIAYHLGEIYLKLKDKEKAGKYFQMAVELNNEEKSVQKAVDLLDSLK